MVCETTESLSLPIGADYGLYDSWFTNQKVINAHLKTGYNLVSAFYPNGIGFQIKHLPSIIRKMMFA